MRVVIALDASARCGEIVENVASRPWPTDTVFLMLHVLDPFPFAKAPISLRMAKNTAEKQLKDLSRKLCAGGWRAGEDVILGRARDKIAKVAASWRADLIVVGSNEMGAWTRLLLGSTARSVLRHAQCSVEVFRPWKGRKTAEVRKGMKILVATDGSECSLTALKSVASRPWPEGSQFKVISIPEPYMSLREFPQFKMKEIKKQNTAALKDAKRYADVGAQVLRKAGFETSTKIPLPRETDGREIVKEAERWHAGLIGLGSHGRRGFERWTIGSVSEHVALHAPCSVEVIRGCLPSNEKSKRVRKKG